MPGCRLVGGNALIRITQQKAPDGSRTLQRVARPYRKSRAGYARRISQYKTDPHAMQQKPTSRIARGQMIFTLQIIMLQCTKTTRPDHFMRKA
jgi:hypothetical protein